MWLLDCRLVLTSSGAKLAPSHDRALFLLTDKDSNDMRYGMPENDQSFHNPSTRILMCEKKTRTKFSTKIFPLRERD
jgi:hypothetical protein